MNGSNYIFTINVNGTQATGTLNTVSQSAMSATSAFNSLGNSIRQMGECAFAFNNINQGLQNLQDKLSNAIAPGIDLNTSMMDLSAVTGLTGKKLKEVEINAREAAKTFGGSAADGAESYKLILSQLSPEIAKVPKALALMGTHIKTTSKTMGNDTRAAAEVLTTAMNQFQVSLADPMQAAKEMGMMMNIMAAAAKEGSAELPAIKTALEQCGMAAKSAGVSFAETNAAIQVLDKAGKKGSEGGVALRNVMATLAQGRFLPKDVQEELGAAGVNINLLTDKSLSLSERLKSLQGIMADDALLTKLFGKENANAALALLSGIPVLENYTTAIQGTNTATEQAQIAMSGYAERMSRMKAWVDDLKITLFNFTKGIMPYVTGVVTFFQGAASVMMGVNAIACFMESAWAKAIIKRTKELFKGTAAIISSTGSMGGYNAITLAGTGVTYGFSFALKAVGKAIYSIPIIGWIAALISLLITAFKLLWDKCEGFRRGMFAIWEVLKAVFHNIGVIITSVWDNIIKPVFMGLWNIIKTVASGIWSAMKWCWEGIMSGFKAVSNFFVSLWNGIMSGVSAVGDFFSGVWNWISETCSGIAETISKAFSWIVEPIKKAFSAIGDFFSAIWDKITGAVSKFFNWIGDMWNKLFPKDKFKDLGEAAQAGLEKGSESFRKSQEAKKKAGVPDMTEVPVVPSQIQVATVQTATKSGTKTKAAKTKSETIDLNNIKGSTNYGAIVAKLTPVKIPSLSTNTPVAVKSLPQQIQSTGQINPEKQEYGRRQEIAHLSEIGLNVRKIAAGIAIIASLQVSPTAALPTNLSAVINTSNQTALNNNMPDSPLKSKSIKKEQRERQRDINFGKFCETVVINTPTGTTQDQAEQIYRELFKRINDARNDY